MNLVKNADEVQAYILDSSVDAAGGKLTNSAVAANRFFSSVVRIQRDRGQADRDVGPEDPAPPHRAHQEHGKTDGHSHKHEGKKDCNAHYAYDDGAHFARHFLIDVVKWCVK